MKRGFSTSEGKLSVLAIIGQVIAASLGYLPPVQTGWGVVAVAVAYALSRGLVKIGGAEAFPALANNEPPAQH
jgi:hypothetical protein